MSKARRVLIVNTSQRRDDSFYRGIYHISFCILAIFYRATITDNIIIITSPAGAVAKYCNDHVCVCVCVYLSASISPTPEPHARSIPFLYMAVSRSSVDGMTKFEVEGSIFEGCPGHSKALTIFDAPVVAASLQKGSFNRQ